MFGAQNQVKMSQVKHFGQVIQVPLLDLESDISAVHVARGKLEGNVAVGQFDGAVGLYDMLSSSCVRKYKVAPLF